MRLAKKLLAAKKAWRSFSGSVISKLQKLKISKSNKYTAAILEGFGSIRRLVSYKRQRKRCAFKRYSSSLPYQRYESCRRQPGFAAIYVDQLFPGETSRGKQVVEENSNVANVATETRTMNQRADSSETKVPTLPRKSRTSEIDDAWKNAVASSPQLRGVDERADEFISQFRREIKLQREKSILDFQEMLERSA